MRPLLVPAVAALLLLAGCATIPPEAPELSAQIGIRLNALEAAHRRLVADFFNGHRRRVDDFVQEKWVPMFTREYFDRDRAKAKWEEVMASKDPNDRVGFIKAVAPTLLARINAKRLELVQPIDELEQEVSLKLQAEYEQLRTLNRTVTALLQSAAKAEANRKRLLELAGVSEQKISAALGQASDSVALLLQTAQGVDDVVKHAEAQEASFKTNVRQIIEKLRQ